VQIHGINNGYREQHDHGGEEALHAALRPRMAPRWKHYGTFATTGLVRERL
jgi:hypothetical protein